MKRSTIRFIAIGGAVLIGAAYLLGVDDTLRLFEGIINMVGEAGP